MDIYLDVCCLNRPFDDPSQSRVHLESEAVLLIISRFETGDWMWVGSDAVSFEIAQTPDSERAARVRQLTLSAHTVMPITETDIERAEHLETLGFRPLDALHIASAERGEADVMLTTDDRLRRLAERVKDQLQVRVANPLTWLTEIDQL